jgi:hypothetical protein
MPRKAFFWESDNFEKKDAAVKEALRLGRLIEEGTWPDRSR